MVIGQICLLVGALVCAAVLAVMVVISLQNHKKEMLSAARKARAEARKTESEQEMPALAVEDRLITEESPLTVGDEPPLFTSEPAAPPIEEELTPDPSFIDELFADVKPYVPEIPPEEPSPKSTRNDFDFKF